MYVIDASVAMKWFLEEPDSVHAAALLEAYRERRLRLVAPDLLVYEVSNALLHNAVFSPRDVTGCIQQLYELELDLIAPSVELVLATVRLASQTRLTFYDALYAALAHDLDMPLVSADLRLLNRLPASIPTATLSQLDVT